MRIIFLTFTLLFLSILAQAQTWQQMDSLGVVFLKSARYKEADSLLSMAFDAASASKNDTIKLRVGSNLGILYYRLAQYEKAITYWHEARETAARLHGHQSLAYAEMSNKLAIVYQATQNIAEAEKLYLEVISVRKNLLGVKHPEYAGACSNLGTLYMKMGVYDKVEELFIRAKEAREATFGKKHYDYAASCHNLGAFYMEIGSYLISEEHLLEARRIREEILGKEHPDFVASCETLANLYHKLGLQEKAEELHKEAKDIYAKVLGKEHPRYAQSCGNLAKDYVYMNKLDKAEPLFLENLAIQKKISNDKFIGYAGACLNMGNIYLIQKNYQKAKFYLIEALTIRGEVLGEKNLMYANSCQSLGAYYLDTKQFDSAAKYLNIAKRIHKNDVSNKSAEYASINLSLAQLLSMQERYIEAELLWTELLNSTKEEIITLLPTLSEKERLDYLTMTDSYTETFSSYCIKYSQENSSITNQLFNHTLFRKGLVFSSTQKMKNAILESGDTVLVNQYNNWKKQRETYTKLYQLPLEEQKKQNLDLEGIKNQINDLEKDLSKKSALFSQNVQTKSYKWQEVKAKLAKNEAVIEIIKADSAYIALFLTAQTENYPAFYLFKNAQELEDKFLNYYKNCIEFKIEDTVSYNAFWKPIADKLLTLNKKGFKKIYLSPDGVFHQLSLNTLKNTKTGKFLLEEANIQLIGSSRDLIELNKKSRDLSQNYENYQAHLLGYPIYGAENTEKEPEKKRDRSLGFSGMQSAVGVAGSVSLLPGTRKEVEEIYALFNKRKLSVNLLLAENATEEALKNLKSPTILHVATHGFFIPEIKDSEVQDMQTAMNRNLLKNPFLRSGLLLAGCQKPNPEGEDGILTAEEVMNLTLDNTELVVMSACETGLGDIQAGEGVFGLQRAFQQAGAKSVLMSLWKVDDEATQTLMTEFYTALLKGQNKRQAFKTAQMNLKKRFPEPYYWGAFVMVGE